MAYQSKQRNPLLDRTMQDMLERRGRELIGIVVVLGGILTAMMIVSYTPDDPSFVSATHHSVQNWLGQSGAYVAAPLFMIMGWASITIAATLCVWGARLVLNLGVGRIWARLVFLPVLILIAALYASTLIPGPDWGHSFGLGGLLGDTFALMILQLSPQSAGSFMNALSLVSMIGVVTIGIIVFGFSKSEVYAIFRYICRASFFTITSFAKWLVIGLWTAVRAAFRGVYSPKTQNAARTADSRTANIGQNLEADHNHGPQTTARDDDADNYVNDDIIAQGEHVIDHGIDHGARGDHAPAFIHKTAPILRAPASVKITGAQAGRPDQIRIDNTMPELRALDHGPSSMANVSTPEKQGFFFRIFAKRAAAKNAPDMGAGDIQSHPPARGAPDGRQAHAADRVQARIDAAIKTRIQSGKHIAPARAIISTDQSQAHAQLGYDATDAAHHDYDDDHIGILDTAADPQAGYANYDGADTDQGFFGGDGAISADHVSAPKSPSISATRVMQPTVKKATPSSQAKKELQPSLVFQDTQDRDVAYEHPPLSLLTNPVDIQHHYLSDEALEENARMLENVLDDYGVKGDIVSVRPGPVVTMYELEPAPGLKASRVVGLADDIARSMSALSARVSTVPGRSVIGIELPNENREKVVLREILSTRDFGDSRMRLPLALGKDIGGGSVVTDLSKMPHLLIAGTTGSGKSVAINTMILSLLYKLTPDQCRLIMIDPKMLELSVYDGIPHLLSPVVTDPKKAVVSLKWVVGEMEERYRKMSKMSVRNIDGYNARVQDTLDKGEMFSRTVQTGFDDETGDPIFETEEFIPQTIPYIVVIVDELADLMMVAGKEIEACIQRLAQMARASGIHLIMATQRPSVDVITGTIKANFPTRISFQVTSKIDSRTILGEQGAEQLLGMGDMLYMAGGSKITRIHGPFVDDAEVEDIVNHLKAYGPPDYVNGVVEGPSEDKETSIDMVLGLGGNTDSEDALYDTAVAIVAKDRKCSTSYIQRKLAIGYNKAARLVEKMEDQGIVSAANQIGKRDILIPERD